MLYQREGSRERGFSNIFLSQRIQYDSRYLSLALKYACRDISSSG